MEQKPNNRRALRPLAERVTIAEAVASRIREGIQDGLYQQGERLSDSRIAEELGVSRGSVREALKLLQAHSFVVQKAHHGTRVISPTEEDVHGACQVRLALEGYAVRVIARRQSPEDASVLRSIAARLDKAALAGEKGLASRLDGELHETLCQLAGGDRMREVFVRESVSMLGFFFTDRDVYEPVSELANELQPFLDALAGGDEEKALAFIEAHIRRSAEVVITRLKTDRRAAELKAAGVSRE